MVGHLAGSVAEDVPFVADTVQGIVVGVDGAGGNTHALASQVLGSVNADAGLDGGIVAFVSVAFGGGSADDAETVAVSHVAKVAFAGNTIEGLVGAALSAGAKDPEVSVIAVALSVLEVAVDTAVLVVRAAAVDDLVAVVADAAASIFVGVGVEGTKERSHALSVVEGLSVVANAPSIDIGLVRRADGVAEAVDLFVAGFAETLIRVGVVVVSGVAVGADASDADVLGCADAGFGDGRVVLVATLARDDGAGHGVFIVGFTGLALGADALDDVKASCAVALAGVEVVDLVGSALDPADSLVDVVELAVRALSAEVVDQVVARLADASVKNEVLVLSTDGRTDSVAALTTHLLVALDAVAALTHLVVDLGLGVALRTQTGDQVEARQAAAGTDSGVPDFMDLAVGSTDAVDGVIGLGRGAETAGVADKVVAFLADALAILVDFVSVAGGSAKTEVFDVASVAGTGLGDGVEGGMDGTGVAGSIAHLEVLRQADTFAGADIVDEHGSAGYSADSKSLVVDFVPLALSADAADGVEAGLAAAFTVEVDLVDSASDHAHAVALQSISVGADAVLGLGIVGGVSSALLAFSVDDVVGASTSALARDDVVDLVGLAGDAADAQGGIVEGVRRALLADTCDQVVAGHADALVVDQDSVDVLARARSHWELSLRDGRGSLGDTKSGAVGVPIDADTGLFVCAVDGVGGADTTLSVDVVESSDADALESVEVKLLVGSAGGSADGQLGVVDVRGGAFCAGTLDEVESSEAGADIVD